MTKLLVLPLLLFLLSCEKNPICSEEEAKTKTCSVEGDPTPSPPAPQEPDPDPVYDDPKGVEVPPEALIFDASVKFTNFERDDEEKVYKALDIIKKVVASREFRDRIINHTYEGKKTFVDNEGLSNEQIYEKLLTGSEDLVPEVDHAMDLDLELYYSWRNTVGYTYPSGLRIWMNTKYFDPYTPTEVAGNLFHEWLHKIGFGHASSYSVSRDYSVPYAIGYLVEELGRKYE